MLDWYRRNQRKLPWRRTRNPYAIWVSEVMLQQTRVDTVVPYYERFLRRFPTVQSLAQCEEDELMKAWEGLGYYTRARRLREAAQKIVKNHQGRIPSTVQELLSLPGIGPYSAGAIASIAFGLDVPVLDGNVTRVLSRLYTVREDTNLARTRDRLEFLALELIPQGRAGLFNQALMDLGATVCIPGNPRCLVCSIRSHCAAFECGEQDRIPKKKERLPVPHYDVGLAVILRKDRVLITKRPPEGLLGGLWEFPGGKKKPGETMEACIAREMKEELGIEVKVKHPLTPVRHAYTHFKVTLYAFICTHTRGHPQPRTATEARWVPVDHLDALPFPKGSLKVLEVFRDSITNDVA